MDNLEELHKQLVEVLGEDEANFIVAYRQGGAYDGDDAGKPIASVKVDLKQRGNVRLTTILDLIGAKTRIAKQGGSSSGGSGGSSQGQSAECIDNRPAVRRKPAQQSSGRSGGGGGNSSGGGNNSRVVIDPAFPNERGAMQTYLPKLMDNLAVNASPIDPRAGSTSTRPRAR